MAQTTTADAQASAVAPYSVANPLIPAKTMLLFVHGFLGSEHSFEDFPLDVGERLRGAPNSLRNVEVRIFPRFDTKGDPTRAVNQLCNWLLLNATEPEFSGVVIMAHSMGGLMCVDAYRKLYGLEKELEKGSKEAKKKKDAPPSPGKDPAEKGAASPSAAPSWLGSWWSSKNPAKAADDLKAASQGMEPGISGDAPSSPTTATEAVVSDALAVAPPIPAASTSSTSDRRKHPPVNIIGIVTFDAPFFGLHSRVYTAAAGTRAASVISQYVPPMPPMPATPALPFGHALQTSASDALRYSTRAVGAIPEAAQGLVGSIPGAATQGLQMGYNAVSALPGATLTATQMGYNAVTALPGATLHLGTSATKMGYEAVTALPGATMQLGTTALQSVSQLPSYWTSSRTPTPTPPENATVSASGEASAESGLPADEIPSSGTSEISVGPPPLPTRAPPPTDVTSPPTDDAQAAAHAPERVAAEMQDESVVFAAAVAATSVPIDSTGQPIAPSTQPETKTEIETENQQLQTLLPDEPATALTAAGTALHPIPTDHNWAPWMRLGLAGAAVAAGAYYSGGLIYAVPVLRGYAMTFALTHAEEARKHLQFLYPLWGGANALEGRMEDMLKEVEAGRVNFKCYYVELPPVIVEMKTKTDGKEKGKGDKASKVLSDEELKMATGIPLPADPSGKSADSMEVTVDGPASRPSTHTMDAPPPQSASVPDKNRLQARLARIVREKAPASTTPSTITTTELEIPEPRQTPPPPRSEVASAFAAQLAARRSAAETQEPATVEKEEPPAVTVPSSSEPKTEKSTVATALAAKLAASRPAPSTSPVPPPACRTFITLPPAHLAHLFQAVHSDCLDEIQGHMNMFARDLNAGSYWGLVDGVAREVAKTARGVGKAL
ncbi:hypothetical protein HKX48_009166 [Thoreauomyces humboldtii]|nr:hypothetical protein HKX48_009166 [Thoreauomyces humboldtii]